MRSIFTFLPTFAGLVLSQKVDLESIKAAPHPPQTHPPYGACGNRTIVYYNWNTMLSSVEHQSPAAHFQGADNDIMTFTTTTFDTTHNTSTASQHHDPLFRRAAPPPQNNTTYTNQTECLPQPAGPISLPPENNNKNKNNNDTDPGTAFVNAPLYAAMARAASTPAGYKSTFVNLNASAALNTYMGVISANTYDPALCAAACDQMVGCSGINMYIERAPRLLPVTENCLNPLPGVYIKCALFGSPVEPVAARYTGQWTHGFHVVVTGSNGYTKIKQIPPKQPGFAGPFMLPGAINSTMWYNPVNQTNRGIFLGTRFFNIPFDPAICAAVCNGTTEANLLADGQPCTYFNAYLLSKDNIPQGTYCAMYSIIIHPSLATVTDVDMGDSHEWHVVTSMSYIANEQPPPPLPPHSMNGTDHSSDAAAAAAV